jgi:hypothetical protein
MRYYFKPTRLAMIEKTIPRKRTGVGHDVDTLEPSYIPGPNVKMLITEEKWS